MNRIFPTSKLSEAATLQLIKSFVREESLHQAQKRTGVSKETISKTFGLIRDRIYEGTTQIGNYELLRINSSRHREELRSQRLLTYFIYSECFCRQTEGAISRDNTHTRLEYKKVNMPACLDYYIQWYEGSFLYGTDLTAEAAAQMFQSSYEGFIEAEYKGRFQFQLNRMKKRLQGINAENEEKYFNEAQYRSVAMFEEILCGPFNELSDIVCGIGSCCQRYGNTVLAHDPHGKHYYFYTFTGHTEAPKIIDRSYGDRTVVDYYDDENFPFNFTKEFLNHYYSVMEEDIIHYLKKHPLANE